MSGNATLRLLVKHDLYSYLFRLQKRFEVRGNGWSDGPPESLEGNETRIRHSAGDGAGESSRVYQRLHGAKRLGDNLQNINNNSWTLKTLTLILRR